MEESPDFIARIHLLRTNEGGRKGPTPPAEFRCPLEFKARYYDCIIILGGGGSLVPGETRNVPIILVDRTVAPRLRIGDQFALWEGKTIGKGEVIEVPKGVG